MLNPQTTAALFTEKRIQKHVYMGGEGYAEGFKD